MPASDEEQAKRALARRLRTLRLEHWPGQEINQAELAEALQVGPSSVSTWESEERPKVPPVKRLTAYATFFATERSVAQSPYQVLPLGRLTEQERERQAELVRELLDLRRATEGLASPRVAQVRVNEQRHGLWHFPENEDVIIVCARLSRRLRERIPYADPENPDHAELYTYADPDALIEAFGHIRAMNPKNNVKFRIGSTLTADEYSSHLVLLGGVDWNDATLDCLGRLDDLPVRQLPRQTDSEIGGFQVGDGDDWTTLRPRVRHDGEKMILEEDIAHVLWSVSPYHANRTVTMCNGMFSRGVLGAVRAVTDARFRDRNQEYVDSRFPDVRRFTILSKVIIAGGQAVTPDWSVEENRLYEWSVSAR